jgi:hypothetical protein
LKRWPSAALQFVLLLSAVLPACSRLQTLTPELLASAHQKWLSSRPGYYRLVIDMQGDRVETGQFDATVQGDEVVSLRRNGKVILPGRGQDYSMDGLFRVLTQEVALVSNPQLLGAPEGYSAYAMARFDPENGRLIRYRRSVGGTKNSIEINVVSFEVLQK